MPEPATLLFDLDGTLTDPGLGITSCIRYAMEKMGGPLEPREAYARFIGPPLQQSFAQLLGAGREHLVHAAVAAYRERFGDVGMWENERYDGIDDVLTELRGRGHRLFVATSKPTFYARPIVERFELAGHFEDVYGAEMDGTRAKKRDLLAHVAALESLEPARTIMIGDRGPDMSGARANGMRTLGVSYGYGSREELLHAGAEQVVGSPAAIVAAVHRFAGLG